MTFRILESHNFQVHRAYAFLNKKYVNNYKIN